MTSTDAPVRASPSPLATATRRLAGSHVLAGLGSLGLAAWMFIAFALSSEEDSLAGVALILGAGYVLLGAVLVPLALCSFRARTPGVAYGCGLGAGLVLMLAVAPAIALLLATVPVVGPPLSLLLDLVGLALVVCSIVGLVRERRA